MKRTATTLVCLVGLAFLSGGCLLSGNYHSAKTLGKGESSFGMTFSTTTYEFEGTDSNGNPESSRVAFPTLLPELTYHIGMSDDVEVGGRIGLSSLAMEGDVKFRFYKSDKLHLALAPAIYYQTLILIEGYGARLPLIMTYDLADNIGVTAAIFGSTTKYSAVDAGDSGDSLGRFEGGLVGTGAAIGLEVRGETFEIRPAFEFTQYVASYGSDGNSSSGNFNTMSFLVHLVFVGGREKQQLNRIEDKLDAMQAPPPGPAPAPAPAPAPPPQY